MDRPKESIGSANRMQQLNIQPPFIGRASDLAYLHSRLESAGLTIIAAEPMMGKSYLFEQFRREIRERGEYSLGFADASTNASVFKAAFTDLYQTGLAELAKSQQAKHLYGLLKQHWPKALLSALPGLKKVLDQDGSDFETLGIAAVNALVKTEQVQSQIADVDYSKARQMAQLLFKLTGKPQILILDAIDRLANPNEQAKLIEECAQNYFHGNGWPPVHIFVAMRSPGDETSQPEKAALAWAHKVKNLTGCSYYELTPWQPSDEEWQALANYLNEHTVFGHTCYSTGRHSNQL